jgi:hypothetical protein
VSSKIKEYRQRGVQKQTAHPYVHMSSEETRREFFYHRAAVTRLRGQEMRSHHGPHSPQDFPFWARWITLLLIVTSLLFSMLIFKRIFKQLDDEILMRSLRKRDSLVHERHTSRICYTNCVRWLIRSQLVCKTWIVRMLHEHPSS